MFPREANAVFAKLPEPVIEILKAKHWQFYTFIGGGGVRFMCSWNTTQSRINQLVDDIKSAITEC
jgi:threonine aldolase